MPNSLKCKIKHLCHNGTITERERDRILKALEQETILDKIRAEIVEYKDDKIIHAERNEMIDIVLEIIGKYKVESEE